MIRDFSRIEEQVGLLAAEVKESAGTPTAGYVVGAVAVRLAPGSFKGGEMKTEVFETMQATGSIMERVAMVDAILRDIPLEYWPTVMESIYAMRKARLDFELVNEPNGISPPITGLEKEVTMDEPTDNSGLGDRIKKIVKRFTDRNPEVTDGKAE